MITSQSGALVPKIQKKIIFFIFDDHISVWCPDALTAPPGWSDDLLLQFSSWLSSSHVLPLCNHHPYHRQWDSKLLLHFQSIGLKLKTTRCLKPKMTKAYCNFQGQSPHSAIKNIIAQWTPKTTKLVAVKSNRRGDQGSTSQGPQPTCSCSSLPQASEAGNLSKVQQGRQVHHFCAQRFKLEAWSISVEWSFVIFTSDLATAGRGHDRAMTEYSRQRLQRAALVREAIWDLTENCD